MSIKKAKNTATDTNMLSESQIRHVLNSLFFEGNNQYLKSPNDISEYDIQDIFSNYLRDQLKNKRVSIKKERKKYDISIQKFGDKKLVVNYRIEIKTFLKNNESLSFQKIQSDFEKLQVFLSKPKDIEMKAFFLIAVTQKKLESARGINKLFSEFCLHNLNRSELKKIIGFGFKVYRSYFIGAGNNGNNEPILNQIRFFLFEIKNKSSSKKK